MSVLDEIAKKYGTDKSSEVHNFCVKYEKYLPFKRDEKLRILEIGILDGKSLKMWKEYFFNSHIVGIDINPECKQYEEERISVEIGSQIDGDFLLRLSQQYGPFDMILDDGSHLNEHVIFSFEHLFSFLKSQGVYIVEDMVTSYWPWYGGGLLNSKSSVEYFKKLCDDVSFKGIEYLENQKEVWWRKESNLIPYSEKTQPDCRTDIESINFLNSIILITKR
jgi:hypothetical protein